MEQRGIAVLDNVSIRAAADSDVAPAAALNARAFQKEAFASEMFRLDSASARTGFRSVVELRFSAFYRGGHPVRCAFQDGVMVGTALYKSPYQPVPTVSVAAEALQRLPHLVRLLPHIRWSKIHHLMRLTKVPHGLAAPYLLLEMLAVAPDLHGHGIGSALLRDGIALAKQAGMTGLYLYTGDRANVDLYSRRGFLTVGVRERGTFAVYHMFHPC